MNRLKQIVREWHRTAFVACNLGLVAVALSLLAPVYDLLTDRDSLIRQRSETLARFQAIAAREAEVQAAAARPEGQQDRGEFLSGPNDSVIGADLQTRLKAIAERSGVRIRTIQGQPTKPVGPLRYIGAQLTINGNLQRIQSAVYEIETSKPYLFVTNASLKLASSSALPGAAAEEPVIEARLDVFGALPATGGSR